MKNCVTHLARAIAFAAGLLSAASLGAGGAHANGASPDPSISNAVSSPVLRRLNRTEYRNALRDLFGIDFPVAAELPADGQVAGFDNIGDALSLSPVLLESYLKVAQKVSDMVLGIGNAAPVTAEFPATGSQAEWQQGMPIGTRGGVLVKYYFPRGGRYELRAFLDSAQVLINGAPARFVNTPTEGVRFFQTSIPIPAGLHTFIATFPDEYAGTEGAVPNVDGFGDRAVGGPVDTRGSAIRPTIAFWLDGKKVKTFGIGGPEIGEAALGAQAGPPSLMRAEIRGPFDPVPAVDTPVARNVLICAPPQRADETACAAKIFSRIARRAYRREIDEADLRPILAEFAQKRATAGFNEAIGMGLRVILTSPDFLFRVEADPRGIAPGQVYNISDYELATRLSFFLWSSLPDDELLDEARRGTLRTRAILGREVHRMIADERSRALVDNFGFEWLGLHDFEAARPDPATYPEFDAGLAHDLAQETKLFLTYIVRENRSVLDVISSDYAFLNERLARLYGIDGVHGAAFRKVDVGSNSQRGGILGQGSVAIVTSHAATTSPILRGKWVLTSLLNAPPPVPPPGVPPLDTKPAADGHELTTREQVERHRTSPVCIICHAKMDPYGFALENYDVIGRWRTQEKGSPIDASAALPHGDPFTGPEGLKKLMLGRPEEFATATVSRLMTYALGRQLTKDDQPTVQAIVKTSTSSHYRFQDLVEGVVSSAPFEMRRAANINVAQESGP